MMDRMRCWLCSFGHWFMWGIPGDLRSAVVGSIVAVTFTGLIAWAFENSVTLKSAISEDSSSFANAVPIYNGVVRNTDIEISFDSKKTRNMLFCETIFMTAPDYEKLLFKFIEKYRGCLRITRIGDASWKIKTNNKSPSIKTSEKHNFCHC